MKYFDSIHLATSMSVGSVIRCNSIWVCARIHFSIWMQCVMKECEYWTQANHGKHGNMFTGVVHVFVFPSGNSCKAHALFICMCAALFPHPPRSQLLKHGNPRSQEMHDACQRMALPADHNFTRNCKLHSRRYLRLPSRLLCMASYRGLGLQETCTHYSSACVLPSLLILVWKTILCWVYNFLLTLKNESLNTQ